MNLEFTGEGHYVDLEVDSICKVTAGSTDKLLSPPKTPKIVHLENGNCNVCWNVSKFLFPCAAYSQATNRNEGRPWKFKN
jgi:hypothetical protein